MSKINPKSKKVYSRRGFFAETMAHATALLKKAINKKVLSAFPRKLPRPPGAIAEAAFLAACTRCDDCMMACPPKVIRTYGPSGGVLYQTPFVTFDKGGCLWCEDFPCIEACQTGALLWPAQGQVQAIARMDFNIEHCLVKKGLECDACKDACPEEVYAINFDGKGLPHLDAEKCVGCGECQTRCPSKTGAVFTLEAI